MKIFITGATGFIGNHLVKRLSQTNHQLYCLVRKAGEASEKLEGMGAVLVKGDVTDRASVLQGMKGCDWVIHLAGVYTYWEADNRIYHDVNVEGTRNVMECALENKVSKVVHVSTVGIYGKPADCPFTEESKEGPDRFAAYFQSKYEGDQVVWDLYKNKGLPVVVVYPCAVLGPNDPKATGQYILNLIKKPPLWGMSKDQIRMMKQGFCADGSKAERELGITYTPVRVAIEDAIASFKSQG